MYDIHFQDSRTSFVDLLIAHGIPSDTAESVTARVLVVDALDFVSGGRYDWIVNVDLDAQEVVVSQPPNSNPHIEIRATW